MTLLLSLLAIGVVWGLLCVLLLKGSRIQP
jgi:hypothetical protein